MSEHNHLMPLPERAVYLADWLRQDFEWKQAHPEYGAVSPDVRTIAEVLVVVNQQVGTDNGKMREFLLGYTHSCEGCKAICHCGKPVHYSNFETRKQVELMIMRLGRYVPITVKGRTFEVDRHYIALHGVKAAELPGLGFKEVTGD